MHRVVERRNTIPILSNVLLTATGASLEMKATDLDLEVTEATPAKVERGGATTVPAHLLYDIVRKLSDGAEVMLKTDEDGNAMRVSTGSGSFRVMTTRGFFLPTIVSLVETSLTKTGETESRSR